jgi:hypothetical protein
MKVVFERFGTIIYPYLCTLPLIERIIWLVYGNLYLLFQKLRKRQNKDWILSRNACLGKDIVNLLNIKEPIYNIQKGRVDYLLNIVENQHFRAKAEIVAPFMKRKDVIPFIVQQQSLCWLEYQKPPKLLLMDSFSELTDQMFVHKYERKWGFCSNYSDVECGEKFQAQFQAKGLLPIKDVFEMYVGFFSLIRKKYGDMPIIFLHFPVVLDSRQKFHIRYKNILHAIEEISKKYPPFYSIVVEDNIVSWPDEHNENKDEFPYHYNSETYETFKSKILSIKELQRYFT